MAKDTRAFNTQNMNKLSVTRPSYNNLGTTSLSTVSSQIAANGSFIIQRGKSNVIIQCPNCQTKFSVNSEVISDIEMPRFHCSRCDNVFNMESPATEIGKVIETPPPTMLKPISIPKDPTVMAVEQTQNQEDEVLQPETLQRAFQSMLRDENKISIDKTPTHKDPFSAIAEVFKEPALSLQIPKEFTSTFAASAPHENASIADATQISMPFGEATPAKNETKSDMPYGISFGESSAKDGGFSEFTDSFKTTKDSELDLSQQELSSDAFIEALPSASAAYAFSQTKRNSGRGPIVFIAPMLTALFLLTILSYGLIKSPEMAEAFARNLSTALPKFAPAGLRVEDIKFNKLVLDSGDTIHVVSGKIRNDSDEKFSEILIEGLAFDNKGKLLASSKINPASSLANSNLKSLTIDMLKNAQAVKPNKKFSLPSGSTQDFIIPFLNDKDLNNTLNKAAYFSARVYSVRN